MFQTPLFIAGEKGHIDIMKALLKHDKIDINKQVPFFFFHFFPTSLSNTVLLETGCLTLFPSTPTHRSLFY